MTYAQAYFKSFYYDLKPLFNSLIMGVFSFVKMIVWRPIYSILIKPLFFTNARKAFSTVFNMIDATSLSGLKLYDIVIFERIRFHSLPRAQRAVGFSSYFTTTHDLDHFGLDDDAKGLLKKLLSEDRNWMHGKLNGLFSYSTKNRSPLEIAFDKVYAEGTDWFIDDIGFRKRCAKKVNELCKKEINVRVHPELPSIARNKNSTLPLGNNAEVLNLSAEDFNCLVNVFYRNHVSRPLYLKSSKAFLKDLIPALCYIPFSLLNFIVQVCTIFNTAHDLVVMLFLACLLTPLFLILCYRELFHSEGRIVKINERLNKCRKDLVQKSKQFIKKNTDGKDLLTMRFSVKMFFYSVRLRYLQLGKVSKWIRKNPLYWIGYPVYLIVLLITAPLVYSIYSRWAGVKFYVENKNQLNFVQKNTSKVENMLCQQMKSVHASVDGLETKSSNNRSHQVESKLSIADTMDSYLSNNTVRVDVADLDCECPICRESPFNQSGGNEQEKKADNAASDTPTQTNVFGLIETGNMLHRSCFTVYCDHEKKEQKITDDEDFFIKNPFRSDEQISSKLIEINQIKTDLETNEIFHVSALCPLTGKPFGEMKRADVLAGSSSETDSKNKAKQTKQSPKLAATPFMWLETKIQSDALYFFPQILIPDVEESLVGMCFSGEGLIQLLNADTLAQHKLKQKDLLECLGKPVLVPRDDPLEKMFYRAGELYSLAFEERKERFGIWSKWLTKYKGPVQNDKTTVQAAKSAEKTEKGNQEKDQGSSNAKPSEKIQANNQKLLFALHERNSGLAMASNLEQWFGDKMLMGKIRSSFFSAASQFSDRDCVTKKIKEVLGESNENTPSDEAALSLHSIA